MYSVIYFNNGCHLYLLAILSIFHSLPFAVKHQKITKIRYIINYIYYKAEHFGNVVY